jgi:hypothetical protein
MNGFFGTLLETPAGWELSLLVPSVGFTVCLLLPPMLSLPKEACHEN